MMARRRRQRGEGSEEEGEEEESEGEEMAGEEEEDDEEEEEDEEVVITQKSAKSAAAKPAAAKPASSSSSTAPAGPPELPYVYTCPTDKSELTELMDGIAGPYVDRQSEVLHRLLAGYHTKLKDGNKEKLATVGGLLLDRLMDLASTPPTTLPSAEAARDRVPAIPAALMEPLCPAIYTIAEQLPVQVALCS